MSRTAVQVHQWFTQGNEALSAQRYDEALECFEKIIGLEPRNADALYNRALCLQLASRTEEALLAYEKALVVDDRRTSSHYNLGVIWYHWKNNETAIACYDKALKLDPRHINSWYNKSLALSDAGRLQEAISCCNTVLELEPTKFEAVYSKAWALQKLKDYDQALEVYDQALMMKPNNVNSLYNKGLVYYYMKKHDQAVECYKKVAALDPNHVNCRYNAGLACYDKGDHRGAIEWYDSALAVDSTHVNSAYNKGLALYSLQDYHKAIEANNLALKNSPNYVSALYNNGLCCYQLKLYPKAIEYFEKVLAINPNHENAKKTKRLAENAGPDPSHSLFADGTACYHQKKYEEAVRLLDEALKHNPQHVDALYNKSLALYALKRYEESVEGNDKVVSIDPEYTNAWYNKGLALYYLKRYDEAMAANRKVLSLDPNRVSAWQNQGLCHSSLGRYTEAIACFDKVLTLDPNHANAKTNRQLAVLEQKKGLPQEKREQVSQFYQQGYDHYKNAQYENAIAAYKRALALDPKHINARYNCALALYSLKRYEESIKENDKVLEFDPQYADAAYNKALALQFLKRDQDAITWYNKAIKIAPNRPNYHYNKGLVYYGQENYEAAISAFTAAVEIEPKKTNALYNRGLCYSKLGKYRDAVDSYDKALQVDPSYVSVLINKGMALNSLTDYAGALVCYDKVINELEPNSPLAYFNKGFTLYSMKKYEEAIHCYDQALKIRSNYPMCHYNKGLAYYLLGKYEAAIGSYDSAIRQNSNDSDVIYNKGIALAALGKYQEAVECYDRALRIKPGDSSRILLNKAFSLRRLGQNEECLSVYNNPSITSSPPQGIYNTIMLENKALACLHIGRFDEAISHAKQAVGLRRTALSNVIVGTSLRQKMKIQEASSYIKQARDLIEKGEISSFRLNPAEEAELFHMMSEGEKPLKEDLTDKTRTNAYLGSQENKGGTDTVPSPEGLDTDSIEAQVPVSAEDVESLRASLEKVDFRDVVRRSEVGDALQKQHNREELEYIDRDSKLSQFYSSLNSTIYDYFIAAMAVASGQIDAKCSSGLATAASVLNVLISGIPIASQITHSVSRILGLSGQFKTERGLQNLLKMVPVHTQIAEHVERISRGLTLGLENDIRNFSAKEKTLKETIASLKDRLLCKTPQSAIQAEGIAHALAIVKFCMAGELDPTQFTDEGLLNWLGGHDYVRKLQSTRASIRPIGQVVHKQPSAASYTPVVAAVPGEDAETISQLREQMEQFQEVTSKMKNIDAMQKTISALKKKVDSFEDHTESGGASAQLTAARPSKSGSGSRGAADTDCRVRELSRNLSELRSCILSSQNQDSVSEKLRIRHDEFKHVILHFRTAVERVKKIIDRQYKGSHHNYSRFPSSFQIRFGGKISIERGLRGGGKQNPSVITGLRVLAFFESNVDLKEVPISSILHQFKDYIPLVTTPTGNEAAPVSDAFSRKQLGLDQDLPR